MSQNNGSKNIWKSIKDYQEDPEVLQAKLHEFKDGVTDDFDPNEMNKVSRRKFLAILAASTAYAATACTSYRDKGEIVPYVKRPEEILPGKPTFYASTFSDDGMSYGILVKTREGRPIKIEGNPDDLINKGKIPSKVHASILNLYDPERLQFPTVNGKKSSWPKINSELKLKIEAAKGIAVVTNPITSPTSAKVLKDFQQKFPKTQLISTQLFNQNNRISAWKKSYGNEELPSIKWDKAKVILSLESDFLGKDGNTAENRILYAKGRNVVETKELSKLYAIEAGMSLSGMNADVRLRLKPQLQFDLLISILNELSKLDSVNISNLDSSIKSLIDKSPLEKFASANGLDEQKLKELCMELSTNKGASIIYAGDVLPIETHLLVNYINDVLESRKLYNFENSFVRNINSSTDKEINKLVEDMNNGEIDLIIHYDSNPVYELPKSLKYAEGLQNVETVVTLSELPNETSSISNFILPLNNILESWGDHKTRAGQITLQQPVISELFDTHQKEEILLSWISDENTIYQDYLKNSLKESVFDTGNFASDFNTFWNRALHDGVVNISSPTQDLGDINLSDLSGPKINQSGFTLVLQNNYNFGTGKYANNGWLQELPHPVSKIAWDNYAAISPQTAKNIGVENNDLISISTDNGKVDLPAFVQPGMAEDTVIIELGYGRTNSGEVANQVGFNVSGLLSKSDLSKYVYENISVNKSEGTYELVSTQEHHALDDEFVKDFHRLRKIIQDGTLDEYKSNPHFLHEGKHDIFSITESHEYKNEKWAMSIDLNKCLGCSECVSSCNVENNVPVVGKDQVAMGREMQWIRIDRYYSGTPEEPIVSTQPMLCQHCDNAPCENVCPVNATNHSPDGLNQMAYNRCVGTRYCANNCPYKVRRFNFYNFRDHFADSHYDNELTYLVNNPEVTVRSRGVIEKCTFCVQNILEARENAIRENRELLPDEVKTSCQSACPTDAIVFGDSNNEASEVTKHREHDLSYHVLEELNIRPNVTYLAKLRNTRTEDL